MILKGCGPKMGGEDGWKLLCKHATGVLRLNNFDAERV